MNRTIALWAALALIATGPAPAGAAHDEEFRADVLAAIADSRDPAVDLNADGIPDVVRTFSPDGAVTSIRVDYDFDGRVDIRAENSDGTARMSEDRDRDGRFDYREIRPAGAGASYSRMEWRDDDGDGFEEAWAFEELDRSGSRIVREERIDSDRDGSFDRRSTSTRPRFLAQDGGGASGSGPEDEGYPEAELVAGVCEDISRDLAATAEAFAHQMGLFAQLAPPRAPPGGAGSPVPPPLIPVRFGVQMGSSCNTPVLRRPMELSIERSVSDGFKCLARHNVPLMMRFLVFLVTQRPEVHCLDPSGFPAKRGELLERDPPPRPEDHDEREPDRDPEEPNDPNAPPDNHAPTAIDSDATALCGLGEVNGRVSWISTKAFNPAMGCLPVAGTIFHEFLHNMGVSTSGHHTPSDLHDSVYGCDRTCFPHPGTPVHPLQVNACQKAR